MWDVFNVGFLKFDIEDGTLKIYEKQFRILLLLLLLLLLGNK